MAAASAVARLADATVATVTSVATASAVAAIVIPNMVYAATVATETSAATASGLANLAVRASADVGMMSAAGMAATPARRVDDTGSNTSAVRAKGHTILLRGLAAATAAALAAFTAANVMEGMDGAMAASPPCLSFCYSTRRAGLMAQVLLGHFCRISMAVAGYSNGGLHESDELTKVIYG